MMRWRKIWRENSWHPRLLCYYEFCNNGSYSCLIYRVRLCQERILRDRRQWSRWRCSNYTSVSLSLLLLHSSLLLLHIASFTCNLWRWLINLKLSFSLLYFLTAYPIGGIDRHHHRCYKTIPLVDYYTKGWTKFRVCL